MHANIHTSPHKNSNITMEEPPAPPPTSLLDLPDKALLTVLRCLAADRDLSSLFSAARAHSTLHKLSAAALTSIDVEADQQQVVSLQLYLARHGQNVSSLKLLRGPAAYPMLDELPTGLQLHRLVLTDLRLQLLPGGGRAGVLQAGAPLKQLEISNCAWRDSAPDAAFAQALSQLPQLEHIKYANWGSTLAFPGHVLSALQQLTSLDVMQAPGDVLEFVHLAPRLRDLKARLGPDSSTIQTVPVLRQLTSLQLRASSCMDQFDVAGLANISKLVHLDIQVDIDMQGASKNGRPAGVAALLCQLQQMTQLTYLSLQRCWSLEGPIVPYDPSGPPAAAYAALTASSTLQHLDVSGNTMPQGAWQHVLPAGRQLPHLRVLKAAFCGLLGPWAHADTARLARCCPNLQELSMIARGLVAADTLQPLQGLTALTALEAGDLDDASYAAAAELTQLRRLAVQEHEKATDAGLLQLTQLRQLMVLGVFRRSPGADILKVRYCPVNNAVVTAVETHWRLAQQHIAGVPATLKTRFDVALQQC
jgi:hypothetical protein